MINYLHVLGSYEYWMKELSNIMHEELNLSPNDYEWPWLELWEDDYTPEEALSEFLLIGKHEFSFLTNTEDFYA